MTFLTIFTAPKPFTDPHIDVIQRNAIRSWIQQGKEVEVILVGEEEGLKETAAELGVSHISDVVRNDLGTPLVSSIFTLARKASNSDILAYINADILLLPNFVEVIKQVSSQAKRFLLIGQRWDLDIRDELVFDMNWDKRFLADIQENGKLHTPAGSDYFVFPREIFNQIPDFSIGRAGWDNWMIYFALKSGWLVVDGTPSILIVHQNHDYSHLPDGQPHYDLEETHMNEALGGGMANLYLLLDANRTFNNGKIQLPKVTIPRLIRQMERWVMPGKKQGIRWKLTRGLKKLRRKFTS